MQRCRQALRTPVEAIQFAGQCPLPFWKEEYEAQAYAVSSGPILAIAVRP